MNQLPLLNDIPERIPWARGEVVFSLSFDQDKILRDIMRLYNKGEPFDVDCTYSTGRMWRKLPQPLLRFDIAPQSSDVIKASSDHLPIEDSSIKSLIFDPPFMPSLNRNNPGKIKERFTAFSSVAEMLNMYNASMIEFWRILEPGGIVVFKCQDTVSSGKNYFVHWEIEKYAREIGFDQIDLFILGSNHVLISSTWKRQVRARKSHCYLLVFSKPQIKRTKK